MFMKAPITSDNIFWRLRKILFFGLEHHNIGDALDAREAVVGAAAIFCASSILILLFL